MSAAKSKKRDGKSPAQSPKPGELKSPPAGKNRTVLFACIVGALVGFGGYFTWKSFFRAARADSYKIVNTFPHDKTIYTQGLIFDDGVLLESAGRKGASSLRRVKLETAETLQRRGLDSEYFGEGIALLRDTIFQVTWRDNLAITYKKSDFTKLKTFKYKGEGWGLTTDGTHIVRSDGTAIISFHNPETFEVVSTIEVKDGSRAIQHLNELEWIEGEIWANIWQTTRIARIDPKSGKIKSYVDCAGIIDFAANNLKPNDQCLNGIAYDPATKRIFVTGKDWPHLYEIQVVSR